MVDSRFFTLYWKLVSYNSCTSLIRVLYFVSIFLDWNRSFNYKVGIWEPFKMKLIWGLQSWTLVVTHKPWILKRNLISTWVGLVRPSWLHYGFFCNWIFDLCQNPKKYKKTYKNYKKRPWGGGFGKNSSITGQYPNVSKSNRLVTCGHLSVVISRTQPVHLQLTANSPRTLMRSPFLIHSLMKIVDTRFVGIKLEKRETLKISWFG